MWFPLLFYFAAGLNGYGNGSLWEISDEGQGGGGLAKSGKSLGKGVVDLSDNSDIDVKSNGGSSGKQNNGHVRILNHFEDGDEEGVLENGFDVNRNKDRWGKSLGKEQQEHNSSMGGSKFSVRRSERREVEEFWRKPSADMEGVRFSNLNYPDEGTSNGYSSSSYKYGEQWRDYKDMDGVSKVQHLEQDRAELLRKLDELSMHLNKSSEMVNNPKEKVLPDGKVVPPGPYNGPDAWFRDGSSGLNRTSRQFIDPNTHMANSPDFNYFHDPYAYNTNGHERAMFDFHPSMHNPSFIPGYGDPFMSPMMRGPHPLPHQFRQQPIHPYFPGHYADGPDSYGPYAHRAMPHPHSCSCFHCYENKRRGSVPAPPAGVINSRFARGTNDPMLYRHEIPGAVGPQIHNARTSIPAVGFQEKQLHTRRPGDFNSEMGGFVRNSPRKVMPASRRPCHPIAGGSPFITCYNCFELLQLPKKALVMGKNHQQKVKCGACSTEINFSVINKKLVVSFHPEMEETATRIDDSSIEVVNSRVSHSHGHVNASGVNFSSDDYSGYDFHSVDRESPVLAADPSLSSSKSQEMQKFHSSSHSTSEDVNSPEVLIAPGEVTKSVHQPIEASLSPSPPGSPLQENVDCSSNIYHAVNRFGKGNRSSRLDQEKAKIEKNTSRQNSLKQVVLASEMDVHDYSNIGVSQVSRDASQEHDHNKGGESFFANIIKKGFWDFSQSNKIDDPEKCNVTVNGRPISDHAIKKAEKLAGPIQPGNYWLVC